jgi:glycine/D-amino acid oxidase-like deaminating enzyme
VDCTIVEADAVASGASGAAAGLLSPPLPWADEPLDDLRRRTFAMHLELAESLPAESGVDYGFSHVPRAIIPSNEEAERATVEIAERLSAGGHEGRWLTSDELRDESDWIDRADRGALVGGSWGQLDPYRFTLALVAAAERRGATVRTGSVSGLVRDGDRITGVHVGGATIEAGAVVVAMGPWSREAAAWLGVPVPVEPLKGQIVKLRPPRELRPFGFTARGDYAITKPGGIVYLGTTEERVGFDRQPTAEARDAILRFGVEFTSRLEDAEVVEQTACLRPLSADELPILGRAPGLANVYLATGHGRQGILMAPATGAAIADLITDGATDVVDLSPFDPARFVAAG